MIRIVDAHVAGQAVRLIVAGVELPEGEPVLERHQRAQLGASLDLVRQQVLWEPRGHPDMLGAMLAPPADPGAQAGALFLDADGLLPLSGTALMAAVTIAMDRGLLVTRNADFRVTVETAAGLVPVSFDRNPDGTVGSVTVSMPPAVVTGAAVGVRWGQRLVPVDLVRCGDTLHAIVDAESAGIGLITLDRKLVVGLAAAVSRHLVATRTLPLAQVLLTGPAGDEADLRIVPVTPGGRVRRSPSTSGSAAVVAVLDAMGFVPADRPLVLQGPSGGTFETRVAARTESGGAHPLLHVEVTGDAWVVGDATLVADDDDPLGEGFVI